MQNVGGLFIKRLTGAARLAERGRNGRADIALEEARSGANAFGKLQLETGGVAVADILDHLGDFRRVDAQRLQCRAAEDKR